LVGHGEHDDASYITAAQKAATRDCLVVCEETLLGKKWASAEEIESWRKEAKAEVDATASKVQREPTPDPGEEEWTAISESRLHDNFTEV